MKWWITAVSPPPDPGALTFPETQNGAREGAVSKQGSA